MESMPLFKFRGYFVNLKQALLCNLTIHFLSYDMFTQYSKLPKTLTNVNFNKKFCT